ncbi:2Fe-2S iron-sulfur cluster-binding protein [Nocardioides hwasunensis]|uniref:2Fe-2S iron-sulfur cluster binding domain-containing protein n=1 Tax=Nocardioides hwasunensis TaxID=397258 RepID=A0ABR8MG54_9ACTN|nr:2Fe-2S iron-sulfur cluster-binding protein [Nocardioides hwasunensis]MBD3915054.1 2Fe-2S iron-sulfur cluster binding domain-containing protein [Nocardioides hwasunensis]
MPKIVFVSSDGSEETVAVDAGTSIMSAAQQHGIEGIVADCGGSCSCATCHVYVEQELADRFDPVGQFEDELLDTTACERLCNSRLSCQLVMGDHVDGVRVEIPESQM